ncbi:MAG: ATP-dependent Clp protease ATP-binding subunit [Archangiaceae bacterium]|nr:ATP-dependent Clp protease ATP-binding subunit [Archangiaceae bacterium]
METRTFNVFVRRFPRVGYSAHVLGAPHLASFGETMNDVYADLTIVCRRLLDRGQLRHLSALGEFTLRRVDLQVRAMQRGRLLQVPMRFSVLVRPEGVGEKKNSPVRLMVPRLNLEHVLSDLADFEGFAEELIRHELHLAPLQRLLEVSYSGEESVRTLTVDTRFDQRAEVRKEKAKREKQTKRRRPLPPGLSEACRRLSDEKDVGTVERAFQRDAEVQLLADTLCGSGRGSVLLVGPQLVGKTTLVHELVHRVADAPKGSVLSGVEVYSTSGARIVAGMRYLGEWQDRVRRMVGSLRSEPSVLHVDSLSELLNAGTGRGDSGLDIAQQLLPSIEAGELRVVIEATAEDVARAERTHGAFVRAFRSLAVRPLGALEGKQALAASAKRLARQRRVTITDQALDRAIDLVERFGEAGGVPGAAVDLLRAAARAPAGGKVSTVDGDAVTSAFVARTGYARELIDPSIKLDPEQVLAKLGQRVVGQHEAMVLLRNLVVTLKTGLCDPSRPLGAYLLLGPTGVGKTESALSLAHYLFGDEKRLTRIDMAEYAAPGSAWRLIAAGAAQGSLTAKVREQPFGVVLLDEVEKADSSVHALLLQLLGEGRLTDAHGRTVSFRNTVVLLTSNLGAESSGKSFGFGDGTRDVQTHYLAAASQFFRPELINRLDQLVAYHPLTPKEIGLIASRVVERALGREGLARRGVKVTWTEAVVERVAQLGFDPRYGARPLKRAVEQHVVSAVASLLTASATPPATITLSVTPTGDITAHAG